MPRPTTPSLLVLAVLLAACSSTTVTDGSGGAGGSTAGGGGAGAGGTGGGGTGGAGGGCAHLPQVTLDALGFPNLLGPIQLQPGASFDLGVGVTECCYVWQEVDACVAWNVAPAGATVDATGLLTIAPGTPNGSVFTVTADVGPGDKLLTTHAYVYTPAGNPLVGYRSELAELPCGGGAEVAPESPIGELAFWANGEFSVTWQPFELYVDYWGTYTFDTGSGVLDMVSTGGNYVPSDVDGAGTFSFDAGDLVLHDLWLGTPQAGSLPARCGHRFH